MMVTAKQLEHALVRSIEGVKDIEKVHTDRQGERIVQVRIYGEAELGNLRAEFNLTRLAEIMESELS